MVNIKIYNYFLLLIYLILLFIKFFFLKFKNKIIIYLNKYIKFIFYKIEKIYFK